MMTALRTAFYGALEDCGPGEPPSRPPTSFGELPVNCKAIRIALIVVAVLTGFFGIAYQRSRSTVAVTFTGTYADDWQTNCGPLVEAAQANCTTRLDARYGRVADVPVPSAPQKSR